MLTPVYFKGEHSPLGSAKSPAPTSPVTATVTPMTMSNGEPAYSRPSK